MREALLERTVQGVTASVCEVKGKQKSIDVAKIPNFSVYHNFEFEPREIRVRKAYSVGHLNYGQHENETSQEFLHDQLRRDWVERFPTLLPENRPRAKSGVSSVTSSALAMGWALQKPRAGATRYSLKGRNI